MKQVKQPKTPIIVYAIIVFVFILNYSRSKKIIIETGSGLRSCYFIC